jgi:putative spermidine/putrescine transport system permease protein
VGRPVTANAIAPAGRPRTLLDGSGAPLLLLPPAAFLVVGFILPLAAVFTAALATFGPVGFVTEPLQSDLFLAAVWKTFFIAGTVTFATWVVGLVYALALGLAPPLVGRILFTVLFVTFWISLLVRTYGWVLALQPSGALDTVARAVGLTRTSLGLYQTLPGLIPPMLHIMLPYMVLPIYAALTAIEPAHLRAARSLGASEFLVLRRVVLPALRSGSLAGIILVFILSLGFYVTPAFLGGPGDQLVSIVIGIEFGRLRNLAGAASMGALLLVFVLVLYFAADRWLRISEQWERF